MSIKLVFGSIFFNIPGDVEKNQDEIYSKIEEIKEDVFIKEFLNYTLDFDINIPTPSENFSHILNIYGTIDNDDISIDSQTKIQKIMLDAFTNFIIIGSIVICRYKDPE